MSANNENRDACIEILENHLGADGIAEAAVEILDTCKRDVILYIIAMGLMRLSHEERRKMKAILRLRINPGFLNKGNGRPRAKATPSRRSLDNAMRESKDFLVAWKIGRLTCLYDMTKEDLLYQADMERRKANGHIFDAKLYEELARPMKPEQRVQDYWHTPEAVLLIREKLWNEEMKKKAREERAQASV